MSYNRLTIHERRAIEHYLSLGKSRSEIARLIGVHRSTVSNEIRRNSVGENYTSWKAQDLAQQRCGRPSKSKRKASHFNSIPDRDWLKKYVEHVLKNADLSVERPRRFKPNSVRRKVQYEYDLRFEQECYRQWYLTRRIRDHIMERLTRTLRRHEDWKRYRKTGWFVIRKGLFNAPYHRVYKHMPRGIVKGHYRMTGGYKGEGFSGLYANRFSYTPNEIQAPVKARKKILTDWLNVQAPAGNTAVVGAYIFKPVFKPALNTKHKRPYIFDVFLIEKDNSRPFAPVKISSAFKAWLCPVLKNTGPDTAAPKPFAAQTA